MGTEEVELDWLEYIYKFTERAYIITTSISNGAEITDNDYAVLEEIYRVWDSGRLPFVKTVCTESDTTTTEFDLFSQNVSSTTIGTQVDTTVKNNKNKKR